MDEFNPYPPYNPEDEYAPIEPEFTEPEFRETEFTEPEFAEPQFAEPDPGVQPPVQPEQPYVQPQQAPQQAPVQQYPQQYAAPVQPAPGYVYPQGQVYRAYPQPPIPPVQPRPAAPYQQAYPQQPPVQPPVYPGYQPQYPQYRPVQQPVQQPVPQPQPAVTQAPVQQPAVYPAQQKANPYQPVYPQQPAVNAAYAQPQPKPEPKEPKPATSTGTKVFIICLCALLAAMVVGFGIYIWRNTEEKDKSNNKNIFDTPASTQPDINEYFGNYDPNMSSGDSYTENEYEITLVPDNGETQKRDDDNSASVGTPDEKAPVLVLNDIPSDKDSKKYDAKTSYDAVCDSIVTVECYEEKITDNDRDIVGSGSGTIISADGYIITNAHVIGNSKAYLVNIILNSGKKYQAKIIGYDTWTDLAVLKIDAKDLKPVKFGDSKNVNVGDDVIAIGSPGGEKFQNSLTKGIVSAVDREISINRYVRYIQSDAAISPGSSGGALCNIYGQVIGITTAKTVATYYENMSFSIPSETVKKIVDDLMRYGYVKERCRVGLTGTAISQEEVYYYGYPQGIEISEIDKNGSLADTDIKSGDILTELDGVAISSFQDVYDVLADHKPGDKIKVKTIRFEE